MVGGFQPLVTDLVAGPFFLFFDYEPDPRNSMGGGGNKSGNKLDFGEHLAGTEPLPATVSVNYNAAVLVQCHFPKLTSPSWPMAKAVVESLRTGQPPFYG